jgi:hypothetical protein
METVKDSKTETTTVKPAPAATPKEQLAAALKPAPALETSKVEKTTHSEGV